MNTPSNLIKSFLGESGDPRLERDTEDIEVVIGLIEREESDTWLALSSAGDHSELGNIVEFSMDTARSAVKLSPGSKLIWLLSEHRRGNDVTLFLVKDVKAFNEERARLAREVARGKTKEGLED